MITATHLALILGVVNINSSSTSACSSSSSRTVVVVSVVIIAVVVIVAVVVVATTTAVELLKQLFIYLFIYVLMQVTDMYLAYAISSWYRGTVSSQIG